jgi:hypothetical protein
MGEFARKADGRRVFTAEFKRTTVERIRRTRTFGRVCGGCGAKGLGIAKSIESASK